MPNEKGIISGKVVDENNVGIENARIEAKDAAGNVKGENVTDNEGKYKIPDLPVGKYTLNVVAPEGHKNPDPKPDVEVKAGKDTKSDFQLPSEVPHTGSISGSVTDEKGAGVQNAQVTAEDAGGNTAGQDKTDAQGNYSIQNLAPGVYSVKVPDYVPASNVYVVAGNDTDGTDFSKDPVMDLIGRLDDDRFGIEPRIIVEEAENAKNLFAEANLILAGMGQLPNVPNDGVDIFGVRALLDEELDMKKKLSISESAWEGYVDKAEKLKDMLMDFINKEDLAKLRNEARRQFNLGDSNEAEGNTLFPALFNRLVEIGTDPLLAIDIKKAVDPQSFTDKTRVAEADELLKELKSVIIQIVRSLSRYGRITTRKVNEKWAPFIRDSLELLQSIGRDMPNDDEDERHHTSLLATLTNKNWAEIAPSYVLGRNGGILLGIIMQVYSKLAEDIDNDSEEHLRIVFQPGDIENDFWTTKIREQAAVIKRYPSPSFS